MKHTLCILTATLLLAACGKDSSTKQTDGGAPSRDNFVSSCVSSNFASSKLPENDANRSALNDICSCTYDESAKGFPNPAAWQTALAEYSQTGKGTAAQRIDINMQVCLDKHSNRFTLK